MHEAEFTRLQKMHLVRKLQIILVQIIRLSHLSLMCRKQNLNPDR